MQQSKASNLNVMLSNGGAAALQNFMQNQISTMSTCELVEVIEVENTGDNPVGFVSVRPLVYRVDADGNNIERPIIHGVPYFRLQGGSSAVILDPMKGDKGMCGFSSRDITMVKRERGAAAPNTRRMYNVADALYLGGMLNGTPEQYVWFDGDDIKVKAKARVLIDAPLTETSSNLKVNGTILATQAITSQVSINDPKGSMEKMRTEYNAHNHMEQGDGKPTSSPSQPMG